MVFQCINFRQVLWEVLKTAAFGLGFQHLPRDLANINALKTMFDPYIRYTENGTKHSLPETTKEDKMRKNADSLLVLHMGFFPCLRITWSFSPAGASLGLLSLLVFHKFPT